MAEAPLDEPGDADAPGRGIVHLVLVGTGAVVATSTAAAISPEHFATFHAVVSCALFAVGTGAMLWAYALGVARSRDDEVEVLGLFFLSGPVAPREVRRPLRIAFTVEIVAVVAAASIRPFSSVAFGILAPMFGLGLMAVWGGRFGTFPPRAPTVAA